MKIKGLKCIICGKEYSPSEVKYVCSSCGGNLDVIYDYLEIKKHFSRSDLASSRMYSIWRYLPVLPLESNFTTHRNIFPNFMGGLDTRIKILKT